MSVKLFLLAVCLNYLQVSAISDEPLFLTPLIESGRITEGREKSRVRPDIGGVKSFTGFLTVDKQCGNNLFFWFVPAEENSKDSPVILWLTGGPGTTSLFGLFEEAGPFFWNNSTKKLVENKNRWTKYFNVVFLDQPVGTEFSFTKKGCFVKNNIEMAKQVYSALVQFFTLFPEFKKNKFYLVGESYSGTYNPAIGVEVDKRNRDAKVKINFKGMILGNPYLDLSCLKYASYWYESGLIEEDSRDRIERYQDIRNKYIKEKNSEKANEYESKIWNEEFHVKLPSMFNTQWNQELTLDFKYFVTSEETRKLIKVGNAHFNATSFFGLVAQVLQPEMIVPATPNLKYLLDKNYDIVFLTGQLDVQCIYSALNCVLNQLKHSEYEKAKRKAWYVDRALAGWVRQGGNLMSVVARRAGHLVPMDQGRAALELARAVVGGGALDLQE